MVQSMNSRLLEPLTPSGSSSSPPSIIVTDLEVSPESIPRLSSRFFKSPSMDFALMRKQRANTTAFNRLSSTDILQPFYNLSKFIKILFVVYIFVSLLYTLAHFYALFRNTFRQTGLNSERTIVGKIVLDNAGTATTSSENALWTGRFSVVASDGDTPVFEEVSETLLFSKMFQYALQPTRVIPYFFRMNSSPKKSEISISTMITLERLPVFNNLINKYKGPVSVVVHINDDEQKLRAIEQLHYYRSSNPYFAQYVDLHLIIDKFDRQFNYWRNAARFFARTDLIMTIDVDFLLCSDLRSHYEMLSDEFKQKLESGNAVFVVPAFEFSPTAAQLDVEYYPSVKDELKRFVNQDHLKMFHHKWRRGHGPTNYDKWLKATEPYRVMEYNYNYEPYVLMKREKLPWCDERFVGYGSNKAACLYEIFLSGVEFWVLPQDFLIHQRHPYPENDRRVERKYNKRLYDAYREETCFRYARMAQGIPNATAIDERICGANLPKFYGL